MTSQTDIDNWTSESESSNTKDDTSPPTDDSNPEVNQNEKTDTSTKDNLPRSLQEQVEQFKKARLREIPFKERYPTWWGRLRTNGMSAESLAEMERTRGNADYHYDDREDDLWDDHFAEVHLHTDLGNRKTGQ
jgi:hypothetical protein